MVSLSVVSRSYCHLCEDMEKALVPLAAEFAVEVEVIDVDSNPALLALYDELVPVLLLGENKLCHYFLDVAKVRHYLEKNAASS